MYDYTLILQLSSVGYGLRKIIECSAGICVHISPASG
jgi:hypothetical protein